MIQKKNIQPDLFLFTLIKISMEHEKYIHFVNNTVCRVKS